MGYLKKAVVSGDIIEVYEYEQEIAEGYKRSETLEQREWLKELCYIQCERDGLFYEEIFPSIDEWEEKVKKDVLARRAWSVLRAKRNIKRLIMANVGQWGDYKPVFLTLTFKDNIEDLKSANKYFTNFIKRLSYRAYGERRNLLKYVFVVEFQKRGAIHYHGVFFNLPYIYWEEILSIWRRGGLYGGIHISAARSLEKVRHIGAYVTSYMKKNIEDERLAGQKCYFCSKGLRKPAEIKDKSKVDTLLASLPSWAVVYENEFQNEYTGKVRYRQYNLNLVSVIQENFEGVNV